MLEQTDKKDEQYMWAMKSGIIQDDESDDWKKRRATPLEDLHHIPRKSTYPDALLLNAEEDHTRTMASLVPDEIIYNISDYSKREFNACLLFGDVSGFTDLCEKYNKSGKGGPSRLTQVLNAYIGAMVQEILSHSGDVLKFSGDAFIALWKETGHLSLSDAVHEAIDCALVIQKTYGTYQTDVEVVVRVKLAVAAGHCVFSLLGDEENSHYIMTGQPIYDIKAAELKSSAGEIVITARVSHHISSNEYLIDLLPDGMHAKILGVGPNWRNIQRQYVNKGDQETYSLVSEFRESRSLSSFFIERNDSIYRQSINRSSNEEENDIVSSIVTDQYALRPAVNYATRIKLNNELTRFIIAPVMRGIEAEEPLESLTEIRQVVILFINCQVSGAMSAMKGIDVANNVYLSVCRIVKNKYGCVNKISNFDKDLMLLVIFGLRGFKHELESQIALKCATQCRDEISSFEYIIGVAAGVTTGKCYCGAFGHALRREYTVIGLVVNKGARLMVAYPDKVTCDRETFLHSKLEARNFILQEYKLLKGILNPGPIYEFKEVAKHHDDSIFISPLPLLGREQELDLFGTLLEKANKLSERSSNRQFFNMLIFQGVYRQGKSRVLEEIFYSAGSGIPIHKFSLSKFDYEVPYKTTQLMLSKFIGLPSVTTATEREQKIRSRLKGRNLEGYFCLLNAVFDVNFEISREYNLMDSRSKYKTLQIIFDILCREIFVKFWIIAIDDSENVDDESWLLINVLLDLNLVFIVATMGSEKEISTLALHVLKKPKIKSIELKGIDKWYHVGLACQMLSVDGIPPELEKIIQLKSNGNPGWVESFLISLMHSGGLSIQVMTRETAYDSGIVIPPLYMTMRLSKEEMNLWVEIMEDRKFSVKENIVATRWKMFVDSCRESYPDLTVAKTFHKSVQKTEIVHICKVKENFNLEDVDPELAIDVIILKTFDALTSYEQLLLKCSAILGDTFPRDMLLYIMSTSAVRLTALAVRKLFEIHVLSCAKGNFIEGGLSLKDRLVNPNEDLTVKCDCLGVVIDESCADLPKYASCGFLRFRSSEFRETTYNLLPENQKREFHEKAIRYLEKETRRCRACGNGYFIRHIKGRLDKNLRLLKNSKRKKSTDYDILSASGGSFAALKLLQRSSYMSYDSFTSKESKLKDTLSDFSNSLTVESGSVSESPQLFSLTSDRGLTIIKKLKDNLNLVRTFSATDFSHCTCFLILNTMYSQLIEHCKGAGLVEKIMNATIEYSYVCIGNKNIPQAIKVLEEALQLLEGPMRDQIELEWMVALKKGKLLTLLGYARSHLADGDAYNYFMEALKCYGVRFPKSGIAKKILKFHYKLRQTIKIYLGSDDFSKEADEELADYCNNVSECLGFLCKHFLASSKWNEAELAATWSLTKALETETDFEKLCSAYANLILISSISGNHKFALALEVFALRMCHKKNSNVELDELKALAYLYFSISRSRLRRAELVKFLHMGYVVWRLATASQSDILVLRILPLLAQAVLIRKQLLEFSNIMLEILYLIEEEADNSAQSWYYALCLAVHLETGLKAIPVSKCLKFMQTENFEPSLRDPKGKRRLIVLLWLWEVRNDNWEAAAIWQKRAWEFKFRPGGESIQNAVTGMYLLEGLIIYMVSKMDKKNLRAVAKAENFIRKVFAALAKVEKNLWLITPRLYHMKAYYRIVKYNDYKRAFHLLRVAKKYAQKYSNELEETWIKHSELAWSRKISREKKNFWREHSDEDTADLNDVEFTTKFVPYTLPVPIYI